MCMDDNTDAKRILLAPPPPVDWKRQLGRPRITWLSLSNRNSIHHNLTPPEGMDMSQNSPLSRMLSMYGTMQS